MFPRKSEECPVCFASCKEIVGYIDDYYGPMCENYITCPNGCYAYEYAYGSTRVYVMVRNHHIEFGWHYTDEPKTMRYESEAIDLVCEAARRAQLEDYWNLVHGQSGTGVSNAG